MKSLSIVAVLFFAASIAGAQATGAQASKIVIINTGAFFDDKTGITRIVAAGSQVTAEMAASRNDLNGMITRVQALEKEIATFRDNAAKGVPVDQNAANAKVAEFERLKREGKFKEEDYNARVQKLQNERVGPQYAAALQALEAFIKSKGYGLVFDVSKDQNGLLVFAADSYDITKEFIALYNSRPPTAGTPPR